MGERVRLERALSSEDPVVAGAALAPAVRDAVGARAAGLVPGGLVIDAGSFVQVSPGLATVRARPAAAARNTFLLLLEWERGQWLLYATRVLA